MIFIRHENVFLGQSILIIKGKEFPENKGDMIVFY